MDASDRKPWDQMPGEPLKAYTAFQAYMRAGAARTIEATAKQLGKRSHRRMEQWSSKWRWRDRTAAWDTHLNKEYEREACDLTKDLKRKHLLLLEGLRQVAVREAAAHVLRAKEADENADGERDTPLYSPTELKNLTKLVIELTLLVTGQPTEHTAVSDGADLKKLSDDELRKYRELVTKMRT